ncbi:MAG: UPF0261 family protein [Deltaproteobacteria bacterium]|nr:MAG: UPF0261 family protein [Deltaproteobacteria bacterium]
MKNLTIVVLGTFDTKGEEHTFIKESIEKRGSRAITVNVGTGTPCRHDVDHDLYSQLFENQGVVKGSRDQAISKMISEAQRLVLSLYRQDGIGGIISAGGGSGTHIAASVMRSLPMGIPKLIVSTVASRDMKPIIGTRDITVMHSVVDLLGINSVSGSLLDKAAAAICSMAQSNWRPARQCKRIALTMFGFITPAAEQVRRELENLDYEVIAFHANGTGGTAMEQMAREGYFDGILDLATHELADELKKGYCSGIGPERLEPVTDPRVVPRLVIPGGLDCAVLEFTRDTVPLELKGRKIFFYDFRSAVRLSQQETALIADQIAAKLLKDPHNVKVLVPEHGWSEADGQGAPLHDPELNQFFVEKLRKALGGAVEIVQVPYHINEVPFARIAAKTMHNMISG